MHCKVQIERIYKKSETATITLLCVFLDIVFLSIKNQVNLLNC